jgi:TetR/AcrR family transcriptional regulator, lmrAB and yxaGH operons repressor
MSVSRQETHPTTEQGSRARLVQAAAELLRRQGYAVTGVKQIAHEASAPMGSFYFHFPGGKEELAAEAMHHGSDEFRDVLMDALNSSDDLATGYARIATTIAERLTTRGWAMGCPVATTALETLDTSPVLQKAARTAFDEWLQVLAKRAADAGVAEPHAQELASNALSLIEGAELLARVARSTLPLTRAATALQTLVQATIASLK